MDIPPLLHPFLFFFSFFSHLLLLVNCKFARSVGGNSLIAWEVRVNPNIKLVIFQQFFW